MKKSKSGKLILTEKNSQKTHDKQQNTSYSSLHKKSKSHAKIENKQENNIKNELCEQNLKNTEIIIFKCGKCDNFIISSDFLNKKIHVLNRDIGIQTECKPKCYIETIEYAYFSDSNFYIFSSLLPNILHGASPIKSEEIYHVLRCEKCKEILGKHYVFLKEKKYEGKYCLIRDKINLIKEEKYQISIIELNEKIDELRKKKVEMNKKIVTMMSKVLKKYTTAKAFIQSYENQQKNLTKDINFLTDNVMKLEIS